MRTPVVSFQWSAAAGLNGKFQELPDPQLNRSPGSQQAHVSSIHNLEQISARQPRGKSFGLCEWYGVFRNGQRAGLRAGSS